MKLPAIAKLPDIFHGYLGSLREYKSRQPAEFWHLPLYVSFWLSLAFFPVGYGWREVTPPVCFIFLAMYYRHAWRESVLHGLKPAWLFICAGLMIVCGIVFSIHPLDSILHAGSGVNKAFILPFIGMECVRNGKELRGLVWAFVFACFWQGLDGVWQAASGHDFIMGYALNGGRLTGSLGDYSVGNYIALAMVPAFAVWFMLRQAFSALTSALVFISLLWPAAFLLQGASSRSGILAVAGAVCLWAILAYGWRHLRVLLYPLGIMAAFMLAQPYRLAPGRIMADDRWDLWHLAWKVFMEHPFFGAGSGQYNAAFRELGLMPKHEAISISHPHDIYLDLLYAHGIIGFTLGMIFLCGFLYWGRARIIPRLRQEIARNDGNIYWRLTAWFWLGYAAWLINGIFGHDFYRIWWLALAMSIMGIMIGAVANGTRKEQETRTPDSAGIPRPYRCSR